MLIKLPIYWVFHLVAGPALALSLFGLPLSSVYADDLSAFVETKTVSSPFFARFEQNIGQYPETLAFVLPTQIGVVYLDVQGRIHYPAQYPTKDPAQGQELQEFLVTDRLVSPSGQPDAGSGSMHRFVNDVQTWYRYIPTYSQLNLGEVWDGVEVTLVAREKNIEKIFTLKPGASVASINLAFTPITELTLDDQGNLQVQTEQGSLVFTAPTAIEDCAGKKRVIPVQYRLEGDHYGFTVSDYRQECILVIDPLLQTNYLAGNDVDSAIAVKTDTFGDVYVLGRTLSTDFPSSFSYPHSGGSIDIYVARFSQDLRTLKTVALLGGVALDGANDLFVDRFGNVFVVGVTDSSNFPGIDKTFQTQLNGPSDAFVLKLSNGLDHILAATYLGGGEEDEATAVVVDDQGQVYVGGTTNSDDFPTTASGAQTAPGGGMQDAFIVKLDPDLKRMLTGTFIGGAGFDLISQISLLKNGAASALVGVGSTDSEDWNTSLGGFQTKLGGGNASLDGFVVRLSTDLQQIQGFTYLGGSNNDEIFGVAISPQGNVCTVGRSGSPDFPILAGAVQTRFNGSRDAIVACLDESLKHLVASSYLGGSGLDAGESIGFLPGGDIVVAGESTSDDLSKIFPITQGKLQGRQDVFVARLSSDLKILRNLTYLGGNAEDSVRKLWVDQTGNLLLVGKTYSTDFPGVVGSPLANPKESPDGWVTRLDPGFSVADFQTGWWWNAQESGRGFMLERRGDHFYLAGFLYHEDGSPLWFVSQGTLTSQFGGQSMVADMYTYRDGQTLLGPYHAPASGENLGQLKIVFSDAQNATLEWPGGKLPMTRFPVAPSPVTTITGMFQPESGWWWNSSESGRGYAIEVQGDYLFMAAFMYADNGRPVWYVSSGKMVDSTHFAGTLLQYGGGQTVTGPYRPPYLTNSNVGNIQLTFDSVRSVMLTLPNGRIIPLERFPF